MKAIIAASALVLLAGGLTFAGSADEVLHLTCDHIKQEIGDCSCAIEFLSQNIGAENAAILMQDWAISVDQKGDSRKAFSVFYREYNQQEMLRAAVSFLKVRIQFYTRCQPPESDLRDLNWPRNTRCDKIRDVSAAVLPFKTEPLQFASWQGQLRSNSTGTSSRSPYVAHFSAWPTMGRTTPQQRPNPQQNSPQILVQMWKIQHGCSVLTFFLLLPMRQRRKWSIAGQARCFDTFQTKASIQPSCSVDWKRSSLAENYEDVTHGRMVAVEDDGERAVEASTDPISATLADPDDERLAAVAMPWSQIEEFWGYGDPKALASW
jgi:hypothetical protein